MKYVALLRGINVGGNSLVKMSDLKKVFEDLGFKNVTTYINSGNVVFESGENRLVLIKKIEGQLLQKFKLHISIVLRAKNEMESVIKEVPQNWDKNSDIRCYVGFVRDSIKPQDVVDEVKLKEGIDFISTGKHVVYMTTLISGLTKSGFSKLALSSVYKEITTRNYNTVKKIFDLM